MDTRPRQPPEPGDFDLTPPEDLRKRRAIRRFILSIPVVVAIVIGLFLVVQPAGRFVKGWQARRLSRQAMELMEVAQWREAFDKARDAYQIRSSEPATWRTIGRLLSGSGHGIDALEWWKKVEDSDHLTIDDRRDYAVAAIASNEWAIAGTQIDVLIKEVTMRLPSDFLLAAQIAVGRKDRLLASRFAQQVMTDPRANPSELVAAEDLVLSSSELDSSGYATAWDTLVGTARQSTNPVSLDALLSLAAHLPPPSADLADKATALFRGSDSPSIGISRKEIANRLETHPNAGTRHRLLALDLRSKEDPSRVNSFVDTAVEKFRDGDDETLGLLGLWLNSRKRFERTLAVLPLERAIRQPELSLRHLDALAGLGRWNEIVLLLMAERLPLQPLAQHMYLASARQKMGEAVAARNEWQRALEVADDKDKLRILATYAEKEGALEIAATAYSSVIASVPRDRNAYAGKLRIAKSAGNSVAVHDITKEIMTLWPDDEDLKMEALYLRLLGGVKSEEVEEIGQLAESVLARDPVSWEARATMGLARLRQGRVTEALKAFKGTSSIEPADIPPSDLAVRAAVLAANGWQEDAKADAEKLITATLLPEERALIAPLLADPTQ